jgi:hypothetical protein
VEIPEAILAEILMEMTALFLQHLLPKEMIDQRKEGHTRDTKQPIERVACLSK